MAAAVIRELDPGTARRAPTVPDWLALAGGPFRVDVPGADDARVRVVTTLLHGNEPSGARALHRWLREGSRPATRLVGFVLSVEAALGPAPFSRRTRPGRRDLNRCFGADGPVDPEGELAAALLGQLRDLRPEALVDLHNTSSRGPAYAVATRDDPERRALTTVFASRMVVTDLRLGSLTEAIEDDVTSVVIECGGAGDRDADLVALAGLERLASSASLPPAEVTVLHEPQRVEVAPDARLAYGSGPVPGADLTLDAEIERHNFAPAAPGTRLGWVGPAGLGALRVRSGQGHERRHELLEARGGELRLLRETQLLMATADPAVARGDCLFYAIPLDGGAP